MSSNFNLLNTFRHNLKLNFTSIFSGFYNTNNNNKLIDAIIESFFILNEKDIYLLFKLYNLYNSYNQDSLINNDDIIDNSIDNLNNGLENKSMNYILILIFAIILISYKISFNLKHMLNNDCKVSIFIAKYGETIAQLVCFCLPLEINKLVVNNKELRKNVPNSKIYLLLNQYKNYNDSSLLESMLENSIITNDILYDNYITIFNLIIYNQFTIFNDIHNKTINKTFFKELTNLIVNHYFNKNLLDINNYNFQHLIEKYKNSTNITNITLYDKYFKVFNYLVK